jgi:hypothetical protein
MKTSTLAAVLLLTFGSSLNAQVVIHDETVSGDLSNNNLAPTALNFGVGLNVVSGQMGRPGTGPIDRDIFSFTVLPGTALNGIEILRFLPTSVPGPSGSFFALAGGTSINVTNASTHLSNIIVNGTGGIFDELAAGAFSDLIGQTSGLGFSTPLGAGTYTAWFQELSSVVSYQIGFNITPVPEASAYSLFGAAVLCGGIVVRRRIRRTVTL